MLAVTTVVLVICESFMLLSPIWTILVDRFWTTIESTENVSFARPGCVFVLKQQKMDALFRVV